MRITQLFLLLFFLSTLVRAGEEKDTIPEDPYKSLYKLDLFRAFQGTIQFSKEWELSKNRSINVGLLGTYASTQGLAKPYLTAQEFTYTDETQIRYDLNNVEVRGYGINFQIRKYALNKSEKFSGFYKSPELFFRQVFLRSDVYDKNISNLKEVNKNLFLGYFGYMIGYQRILRSVVSIDAYLGGGFFYSHYAGDKNPTRYRNTYQIDYTGFYLNTGILVGITK